MNIVDVNGQSVEIDEDGFLVDPGVWSDRVVEAFAKLEGVDVLTDNHWKVVHYLRNYWKQFGIAPMIRKLCKDTGFTLQEIYQMFPSGPAKGACKLAGLPKPTGCV